MKKLTFLAAFFVIFMGVFSLAQAADIPPGKGDLLPVFSLPIPPDPQEKVYLGLSGDGLFKIAQLKARVVIIEIFSMYCPYCQGEAPKVNGLYQAIEDLPALKGKIKLIGIGAGNTPFEVDVFKKNYQVPFPLFADQDFVLHKLFGEVRTPYFLAVKINKDQPPRVIFSELGSLNGTEAFLKKIRSLSGLKLKGRP